MNASHVLVTVSGPDHPGITATLMDIIVDSGNSVCDMGQSVTHGLLSLSIYIQIDSEAGRKNDMVKDLLFATKNIGLVLNYQMIDEQNSDLAFQTKDKFILNCISVNKLHPKFLRDISKVLADHKINILRIDNVTPKSFKSLEMTTTLPDGLDIQDLKSKLMEVSTSHEVDMAFLKDNVFRRSKRLIVFDMDSTLVQTEVIDEMADQLGVGKEVREITHRAMNGEIDFDQSLIERVSLLKGLKVEKLQEILDGLSFTHGAEEFIKKVKSLGYKIALISGGFSFFADALKEKLDLDYSFANELDIINGALTGKLDGTIINANQKAMLLKLIAQQEKISLEQVVAVGDGANDLPMLSIAGLGIAYHAKDIVKKEAPHHMGHGPMTSILYFLGINGES
ncbi:MAG: phosphoserine phosphatase SerB [Epsilonproteobacteria bacterium]|nr:MAG: phosphoserine phosphatase SerB [Campylobacterota bacterium]RLA68070.1 MAG: phosphoserine phosphatase SerB [Campylobacterota bacterium]